MFGSVWYIWFGSFGSVGLVLLVWFGLVNKDDLKRSPVPSKLAIARLELNLGTILGWVGPIVILRLTQSTCAGAGTDLGKIIKNLKNVCTI